MTSQREQEDVLNPFLNPIRAWQNYLVYWNEVNKNFYENAIRFNKQWFKAYCDPWFKAGKPSQKETVKIG